MQSTLECPGFKQVLDCMACRNLNSSTVDKEFYNDIMDMMLHVCVLSMSNALSVSDWSFKSNTAKIVQSGSLNADKKVESLFYIVFWRLPC